MLRWPERGFSMTDQASKHRWVDPGGITRFLAITVGVLIVMKAAALILTLVSGASAEYMTAPEDSDAEAPALRAVLDMSYFLILFAYLIGAVWAHRVAVNAHSFGVPMRHGTAGAFWWFFAPVAGYIMPYFVIREAAHVSGGGPKGRRLVLVWWLLFVASNMGLTLFLVAFVDGDPGFIVMARLIGDALALAGAVVFMALLFQFQFWQRTKFYAAAGYPPDEAVETP